MTELPIQRLLLEAVAVVERLQIPYAIMGGFAVRVWAIPRPTYDADLAISAEDTELQRLLSALEEADFEVPPEYRTGFVDVVSRLRKVKVTRIEEGHVWDVDLFLVLDAFLRSALARRRICAIGDQAVHVMSQEDVILLKLAAFRRKDQLDVEEILKVHAQPDLAYLRTWAEYLQVLDRLDEFL